MQIGNCTRRTIGGVLVQSLNGVGQLMYADTAVTGRLGGGLFCTPGDREDTSFWVADIPRDPNVFAAYVDSNVKVAESHIRCTLDGTASGLTTGIRDFGFALASGNVAFAAVPTDHETVQVFRRYGFGGDWLADSDVESPYGPDSAVFWPNLATAGDAVGLTFGTSVGSDLTRIDIAVTGIIDSSIQTPGTTGPLGVFDEAYALSPGGHAAFGFGNDGDFMGLAAGSGRRFVAAWTGRAGTAQVIQTSLVVMRHGVR